MSGEWAGLALSPDGATLAVGRSSGAVLRDTRSGAERSLDGATRRPWRLAYAPDGSDLLALGLNFSSDWKLFRWDVASGRLRPPLPLASLEGVQSTNNSHSVALSPDGRLLAVATAERFLALFDAATGDEVRRFDRLPVIPTCVAFARTAARWSGRATMIPLSASSNWRRGASAAALTDTAARSTAARSPATAAPFCPPPPTARRSSGI